MPLLSRHHLSLPTLNILDNGSIKRITILIILLVSMHEPRDIIAQYEQCFSAPDKTIAVNTYSDMHHGFMGASANLEDSDELHECLKG